MEGVASIVETQCESALDDDLVPHACLPSLAGGCTVDQGEQVAVNPAHSYIETCMALRGRRLVLRSRI